MDAVLIATATDTHADLLEQAIAAGKPMLCEKPIDLSLARVNRCAAVIAGTPLPIQLGFVRRFDPGHKAVFDAVRNGEIGELHQVIVTSRDPGLASDAYLKASGGILRDMTIHDFDRRHQRACRTCQSSPPTLRCAALSPAPLAGLDRAWSMLGAGRQICDF